MIEIADDVKTGEMVDKVFLETGFCENSGI